MTPLSARSILVNLSLKKKKASNRPKTIGVFTCTKPSCSDERLPIGYSLPDFQPHRSNFLAALTAAAAALKAPTTAGAAATAARRANPHLLTAPCFHRISFYSAKTKQFTQPKRIYSANGNPFMPMIWRFWSNYALYKWLEIVYTSTSTLANNIYKTTHTTKRYSPV